MPKIIDKVTGEITERPYTSEGIAAAEADAMSPDKEVVPTYDAGGRVERIMGYGDGGKVKK